VFQRVAACYLVLQGVVATTSQVAVCCNVLQRVAACYRVLQRVVTTITGGCVLQRVAVCCSVLQGVVSAIMYVPEVDLMHIHLNRIVNCVGRVAHVLTGVQIFFSSLV